MHKIKVLIFGLLVILLSQSGFAAPPGKNNSLYPALEFILFFLW